MVMEKKDHKMYLLWQRCGVKDGKWKLTFTSHSKLNESMCDERLQTFRFSFWRITLPAYQLRRGWRGGHNNKLLYKWEGGKGEGEGVRWKRVLRAQKAGV